MAEAPAKQAKLSKITPDVANVGEKAVAQHEAAEDDLKQAFGEGFVTPLEVYIISTYLQDCKPSLLVDLELKPLGLMRAVLEDKSLLKSDDDAAAHLVDRHWNDPPEFLPLLAEADDTSHYGYFRDKPTQYPVAVICNNHNSINTFSNTCNSQLGFLIQRAKERSLPTIAHDLTQLATRHNVSLGSGSWKHRAKHLQAKTLSGAGIQVPYDSKADVGYRPLACNDSELKQMLTKIEKAKANGKEPKYDDLDRLIQWSNIANDEHDFGNALHLGLNLFAFSTSFTKEAVNLLVPTYQLLDRELFGHIVDKHAEQRA
eukprot:TRINITY_DN8747_c0_g1_i2.p1 TRINITY_DN8747_c0_g1~~TRINITY_DN8747_c0_g1_i2.p1  ORF type:complete len:323 (+),score=67.27 TRINITY_DN8747_c0_g1_i2:26-970(+)